MSRLLQIATATLSDVPEYRALRQRLSALAGDVAGRYANSIGRQSSI